MVAGVVALGAVGVAALGAGGSLAGEGLGALGAAGDRHTLAELRAERLSVCSSVTAAAPRVA
jgi:hypothetical protein